MPSSGGASEHWNGSGRGCTPQPSPGKYSPSPFYALGSCQLLETQQRRRTQTLPSRFYDLHRELLRRFGSRPPGLTPKWTSMQQILPGSGLGISLQRTAPFIPMHSGVGALGRGRSPCRHAVGGRFCTEKTRSDGLEAPFQTDCEISLF